jgi:hypothetical protein
MMTHHADANDVRSIAWRVKLLMGDSILSFTDTHRVCRISCDCAATVCSERQSEQTICTAALQVMSSRLPNKLSVEMQDMLREFVVGTINDLSQINQRPNKNYCCPRSSMCTMM